ncbi:hypothetical protein P7C70_g4958, partial [Phenoliferia sp. Uapishka_3]
MLTCKTLLPIALVCGPLLAIVSPTPSAPSVIVRNGTLQGIALDTCSQEGESLLLPMMVVEGSLLPSAFLGIPFAVPPVGTLRLRPAQSLNSTFEVLEVTEYSPFCPGFGSDDANYTINEDCLTLNVIRPKGIVAGSDVPVGFWIYGGGYSKGGSGDHRCNGTWVVQRSVAMGKPIALKARYPLLTDNTIEKIFSLYPDDPTLGSPYGTGDGVLATGVQDKEVVYVLSNPLPTQNPLGTRPSDRALAKLMTSHWISFIHDLDPNYTGLNLTVRWPNYASEATNMVFERHGSYIEPDNFREEGIAFVNLLGKEMKH